jgi:hypothetical protein
MRILLKAEDVRDLPVRRVLSKREKEICQISSCYLRGSIYIQCRVLHLFVCLFVFLFKEYVKECKITFSIS